MRLLLLSPILQMGKLRLSTTCTGLLWRLTAQKP